MIEVCDFTPPYRHAVPMQHAALQVLLAEWPDECIWWQLKSERYDAERMDHNYTSQQFLTNLETEWANRQLCSRCFREIDRPLAEQFAELEGRVAEAQNKIGRIRQVALDEPDNTVRPAILKILNEL